MFTRWAAPQVVIVRPANTPAPALHFDPAQTSAHICWPTLAEITSLQGKSTRPEHCPTERVWIPDDALDMRLRLCIIAHMGSAGHQGIEATTAALHRFHWTSKQSDVRDLITNCLHCLTSRGPLRIPRPSGTTIHGTHPNKLFDYLFTCRYTQVAAHGFQYVLVVTDDFSHFIELIPVATPTAPMGASIDPSGLDRATSSYPIAAPTS